MKVIIDGFKNVRHVEMFVEWYEGGGEQAYGDYTVCVAKTEEEMEMTAFVNSTYPVEDGCKVNIRGSYV